MSRDHHELKETRLPLIFCWFFSPYHIISQLFPFSIKDRWKESLHKGVRERFGKERVSMALMIFTSAGSSLQYPVPNQVFDVYGDKPGFYFFFFSLWSLFLHRVDLVVHSLKDLPTSLPVGFTIGAVLKWVEQKRALCTEKTQVLTWKKGF